jgi:hypothetical protein
MTAIRVYTLAFCTKDDSPRSAPEIVVIFEKQISDDFFARIARMVEECQGEVREHLFEKNPEWASGVRYGYGGCAVVEREGGVVRLCHPLTQDTMYEVVDTLRLTFSTLNTFVGGGYKKLRGKKKQWCQVQTYVCPERVDYRIQGHVYGYTKARIGARIGGSDHCVERKVLDARHSAVEHAMQEVWRTLAPQSLHGYASRCALRVGEEGYFQLSCHGNMCELSTYPQMGVPQFIGSYGVHTPHQQLTLLAGFARLMELCD